MNSTRVTPYGDSALLVESDAPHVTQRWETAHRLGASLRASTPPGVEGIIATFDTLVVEFDPLRTDVAELTSRLLSDSAAPARGAASGREWIIPILYGGDAGPDMVAVADELGITPDDFIDQHSSASWRVSFNGAPGGAPLHEGSPFASSIRRRPEPRIRIPAGSLAVAGHQGTFYTIPAPGGWRLIGRTPLRLIAPERPEFVAIQPGDVLRFRPISAAEFAATEPEFVGSRR